MNAIHIWLYGLRSRSFSANCNLFNDSFHQNHQPHCGFTTSMQVENLVTKRSAEITGPGQFDTSEFSKQVNIYLFV